ncbi:hypothetical protein SORBI_3010G162900 [Sorghum bicolor]|uniref:FAD-binding PCMH-type domain-containing protein n=1 Tax=Sorghum bicolor TaxID=4558 RepID=C5Z483_SORBI|nr:hypothetical protein SORBI_3010G162900 [Sorghum bicolor]
MAMAIAKGSVLLLVFTFLCFYDAIIPSHASPDDFPQCLSAASIPSQLVFTQRSPSFTSVLVSSIRNPRFFTPSTVRPQWILTPTNASHVQAAVVCGRRHGVRLRVRSGGHDYEGLSYRSQRPEVFAVVDLSSLRAVRIDTRSTTAWVDSGATLGELYYAVAQASDRLAFPAGLCPTIGVGGHLSGGGFGTLLRKYGLASDNVLDAVLVDADGRLLDRTAMGSDVFWALRGGGGESFGIVLSWQVRLVPVPPTVTAFRIPVAAAGDGERAVDVVTRWQEVAPALPDDLFIRALVQNQSATFESLYLGTCDELVPVMRRRFPELGMNRTHCQEMTWIQTVPYFFLGAGATVEDILNRTTSLSTYTKMTSDYVRQAIRRDAWVSIFGKLAEPNAGLMILDPYGGARIGAVPEPATPFPHRAGVLYNIQYVSFWSANGDGSAHTKWVRDFYAFMAPYVSSSPREAYFNYRDLDLGENVVVGNVSSYEAGKVWGEKYFGDNYKRLAMVKGEIDPDDYFRNEQSIPPLVLGN